MKKVAVVFPGQGSQSVGMLSSMAEIPVVRKTFDEAGEVLGYDVWELAQQGPEEKLNQTQYTQPVLLTADIAVWSVWKTQQTSLPVFLAGHSLGEYAALVAAEALSFPDALRLVAKRGVYMQDAVPPGIGAMAAIVGLNDNQILELCEKSREPNEILTPANFNSIGQTVIAGHSAAVDRAIAAASAQGAKLAKRIPVSVPSHCLLMQPAAQKLAKAVVEVDIRPPKIPVIHNDDVSPHPQPDAIRQALVQQLIHPVRWVETIQFMERNGVQTIIECGPGKVLTGLNKRITPTIPTYPTT